MSTEILRKFVFLQCLKRANLEENLDLFKQLLVIKPVIETNINKNFFSPKNEPHEHCSETICLSAVLKHFWGNS